MKKDNLLTIHLLGEFMMENDCNHFPKERKKSVQVILLIAYLIAHRHTMVTKEELINMLWAQQDIENPEGALRNLIYRARKELSAFFPENPKQKCILSKGNAYAWNANLPQFLDVDDMERLCERIMNEKNIEDKRMDVLQLCTRYHENFMHEFGNSAWIKDLRTYYQNLLLKAVENSCKAYIETKRYEYVIEVCSYIDFKSFFNSHIHEYKLYAYYKMDQVALAISYYHQVVDMYYSNMGVKPTDHMREIYHKLSEKSLQNAMNVATLEKSLSEEKAEDGAFYCDFDIFRNIYQINQRSVRRSTKARYLVLLTLVAEAEMEKAAINQESEILYKVINEDLRKNDVFSRCNNTQFAIIVATSKEEGCVKAIDRIVAKYEMKKKQKNIHLQFDMRDII